MGLVIDERVEPMCVSVCVCACVCEREFSAMIPVPQRPYPSSDLFM